MEDILVPMWAILFTFGVPLVALWQFLATRHRERMTIIDRGLDPKQYAALYNRKRLASDPLRALKWALVLVFGGAGLFLGAWMVQVYCFHDATTFAMTLIGAGMGLLIYFPIAMNAGKSAPQVRPE